MIVNKQIIRKINDQYILCKIRHYKHTRAAEYYKSIYVNTTIPIILLSSSTTVLAGFNGNLIDKRFSIAVAVLSGLTTIGQSLASFLEYNAQYDKHNNASTKYINLVRMIETQFYTNYYKKNIDPEQNQDLTFIKTLFDTIQKELDMIQDAFPIIPAFIEDKQIKYENMDINTDLFVNPIFPIEKRNLDNFVFLEDCDAANGEV